ncbi:hypothetical protein [Variovorax sp. DAIF25]|jgi:hypothetical protein|uniref:hypothetical protein n=1 Tax=Variovorax sp. DAIF25 TaxID=3080983 RepID=UPI003D6BB803
MSIQLPAVYRVFIATTGLFEGFVSVADEEHRIILWGEDEATTANSELHVSEYAPAFVGFAGNGGNEIYAFDKTGAVFMLPMIGMDSNAAIRRADDFLELARGFQRPASPAG